VSGWVKKRRVMRRYDAAAHLYEMRYGEEQACKIEAALRCVKIDSTDSVLDVGCGTGVLFDYVSDKVGTTVGLDVSRKTLLLARERARDHANVHLVRADVDNMPVRSGVFTRVFAMTVIQNTPRPAETLIEIKRAAEDGAVIVVTGLKALFSEEAFGQLLKEACLRVTLIEGEGLKCHVAVCTKNQ
jgi:ubiquinone/menaquinone biosynthesis C-methylase UbiE